MVVKNIVNIQNNKLDFDINGTNSLKYSFRGIEHFRLSEVDGTSHVQFIAQKALSDIKFKKDVFGTNADFIGRISNIDNHTLSNLGDVESTSAVADEVLVYDGTSWKNKPLTSVGAANLTIGDGNSTSLVDLRDDTFKILGTDDEIETTLDTSNSIIIGLPDRVIISDELLVGTATNSGAASITTIANFEAIFRNNIAPDNSGIKLGTNGKVIISSENMINMVIGTSSRLEVDATNSVFATDLYVVNKDSQGTLIDTQGGHFHSDGTNFYIAYHDGTNVTDFATTDYAIKLESDQKTFLNAPSGGSVLLSINNVPEVEVKEQEVFIRNELIFGGVSDSTNAMFSIGASGHGVNRTLLFTDNTVDDNFIKLSHTELTIDHASKLELQINEQNRLVINSSEVLVNEANLEVDGHATINESLVVEGTTLLKAATTINANLTLSDGGNLIVGGNTTIDGNLTVNGTTTILNTEIKLIEDPLIELGYFGTNALSGPQDIGFFGQYKVDNYAGLYYDVSSTAFRVFDSLGKNDYETSLATNPNGNVVTTNAMTANIEAKKFITVAGGDVGQEVHDVNITRPSTNPVSALTILQNADVYGTGNGLFSGKLLADVYNADFSDSASSIIHYTFHVGGTNPSEKLFISGVESESKIGSIDFIDFNSDNNNIIATVGANATSTDYRFRIRILPISTRQAS